MRKTIFIYLLIAVSCQTQPLEDQINSFVEIGEINIEGGNLAAEISAYDEDTRKLFVTNNAVGNRVDIIDLSDPTNPILLDQILLKPWPDIKLTINSLAVENEILAVAVSAENLQNPGTVFFYETKNFEKLAEVEVGAMPDNVIFTPDGSYALTANEGEPDQTYTTDPPGSVSIIETKSFTASHVLFDSFADKQEDLRARGFRIFGLNASFSQDIEPEYVASSEDGKYAWVTLQENNGIAKIDIEKKQLLDIFPLGFKDFREPGNEIDVCDNDDIILKNWPIKGMYQPDAIATFKVNGEDFLITANEGDARDYQGYSETARVSELLLDTMAFDHLEKLKSCDSLGRLIVTTTMGDHDGDGDFDEIYVFGTRSFSIWNGTTGELIMDSKNQLEKDLIDHSDLYDDQRSDDKGTEPETVVIGYMKNTPIAFIALERANAVVSYDLSDPANPKFLQVLETGIGPEGVLFIDKQNSPNGTSLLIVSSEVDGKIKLYQPQSPN